MRSISRRVFQWQYRGWVALAAAAVTLYFVAVLFPAAARRSGSPANRIVDLQRASTREAFIAVLERWSESRSDAVKLIKRHNIIELDLLFPIVYATAFAFSYASLRRRTEPTTLDLVLFMAPFAAALFDYVENTLHLRLLSGIDTINDVKQVAASGGFDPTMIALASASAHAKYVLLAASTAGIVVAAFQRLKALL